MSPVPDAAPVKTVLVDANVVIVGTPQMVQLLTPFTVLAPWSKGAYYPDVAGELFIDDWLSTKDGSG